MSGPPLIDIEAKGLAELQSSIKQSATLLAKAQRRALKDVATEVAGMVRNRAASGSPLERRYAGAIAGTSTQKYARITIRKRGQWRGANTAFMGAKPKTRSGWNRYSYRKQGPGSPIVRTRAFPARSQFPEWVGNTWIAGKRGEGPYVINPTIADNQDRIDGLLARAYARAVNEALGGKGEP